MNNLFNKFEVTKKKGQEVPTLKSAVGAANRRDAQYYINKASELWAASPVGSKTQAMLSVENELKRDLANGLVTDDDALAVLQSPIGPNRGESQGKRTFRAANEVLSLWGRELASNTFANFYGGDTNLPEAMVEAGVTGGDLGSLRGTTGGGYDYDRGDNLMTGGFGFGSGKWTGMSDENIALAADMAKAQAAANARKDLYTIQQEAEAQARAEAAQAEIDAEKLRMAELLQPPVATPPSGSNQQGGGGQGGGGQDGGGQDGGGQGDTPESPSSIPKVLKQLQDNLAKAQASGNQAAITKAQNTLNKFREVQGLDAPAQPQGGGNQGGGNQGGSNQVGSNQVGSNQGDTVAKDVLKGVTNLNQLETLFNSAVGADLGSTEILPFLMDVIGMSQEDASQEYMRLLNVREGRGISASYQNQQQQQQNNNNNNNNQQQQQQQQQNQFNMGRDGTAADNYNAWVNARQGTGEALGGTISPGAYAAYGDNPYAAYTDWRRSLYGDAPMAERIRLEEAGMPFRGYGRALGGFLLGSISPYGTGVGEEADETLMATDFRDEVGEAQAFMDYLKAGQFGTQQDLRTRFGGLADYLGRVRGYQEEGADLPDLDPYYQTFGLDPSKTDIMGAATAALGYGSGMGSRTRRNLERAYDILGAQRATPGITQPTGARFADWVSTAF